MSSAKISMKYSVDIYHKTITKVYHLLVLAMRRSWYIKSRSLVWFIMTLFVPGMICMYWLVAIKQNPQIAQNMTAGFTVTYYLTIVTISAFAMSHMKEHISRVDIQHGGMGVHLLKPFSYYFYYIIFEEVPYRLVQGGYGIAVIFVVSHIFPSFVNYHLSSEKLFFVGTSVMIGFFLCFTLEMVLGLFAFWIFEMRLIHNTYEIVFILLGGVNIPIFILPDIVQTLAFATPFPAVVYVPTLMLTGKISGTSAYFGWILYQLSWFGVAFVVYRVMWKWGLRRFTVSGI
jgi:ABC-type uncharacterized transport system permease subunit